MRLIAIAATAAMIFTGAAQAQALVSFSFSKSEPRRIVNHDFTVEVGSARRNGREVWIAKRIEQTHKRPDQITWTDSEACPAMMPAFAKLQSMESFTIVPPSLPGDRLAPIILDGATYHIRVQGYWGQAHRDGEIDLSSNDGPVADWVEETMKVFAPCWKPQRPGG